MVTWGSPDTQKWCVLFLLSTLMLMWILSTGNLAVAQESEQGPKSRSGYEDVPQFGGPSSTGSTVREDNRVVETVFRFDTLQRVFKPYYDFKERLNKSHGLTFGGDYTALHQGADVSADQDRAGGGIFRFYGTWTLLGRESGNTGSVVYKAENRHTLGTDIPPQDLGFAVGYAGLTSGPFTDFGWGVTNLYWQQKFMEGRVSFIGGVVDATDYVDIYGLINPWTAFSNLAFLTSPTIPVPNQGLGAALGLMLTDNIYTVAGLADANGQPTVSGFDSFFNVSEYFSHIELGWASSFERRYFDNVHVTAWHADERTDALVPDGWGVALSATKFIADKWMPFLRAGYAEDGGVLWERSVSTGLGYFMKKRNDLVGLGLNWGRPSETGVGPGLDDQYTTELFYRLQFSQNFALTPDIQWIIDPALNPEEDHVWILGIRGRLTF